LALVVSLLRIYVHTADANATVESRRRRRCVLRFSYISSIRLFSGKSIRLLLLCKTNSQAPNQPLLAHASSGTRFHHLSTTAIRTGFLFQPGSLFPFLLHSTVINTYTSQVRVRIRVNPLMHSVPFVGHLHWR